jgi:hypothetical protein
LSTTDVDNVHEPHTIDVAFQEDTLQGSFSIDLEGSFDDAIISTNVSDDALDPKEIKIIEEQSSNEDRIDDDSDAAHGSQEEKQEIFEENSGQVDTDNEEDKNKLMSWNMILMITECFFSLQWCLTILIFRVMYA